MKRDTPVTASFLDALDDGVLDLHEIARKRGFTRRQMARWIEQPRAAAILDELAHLADRRAELLIATGRAEAARCLLLIATLPASQAREISRKACLDVLKLGESAPRSTPATDPLEEPEEESEEALQARGRAAFEALARIAEEHHGGPTESM